MQCGRDCFTAATVDPMQLNPFLQSLKDFSKGTLQASSVFKGQSFGMLRLGKGKVMIGMIRLAEFSEFSIPVFSD